MTYKIDLQARWGHFLELALEHGGENFLQGNAVRFWGIDGHVVFPRLGEARVTGIATMFRLGDVVWQASVAVPAQVSLAWVDYRSAVAAEEVEVKE